LKNQVKQHAGAIQNRLNVNKSSAGGWAKWGREILIILLL